MANPPRTLLAFASYALSLSHCPTFTPSISTMASQETPALSLVEFPNEVLLTIFADSGLDYHDLKALSRVCNSINKFIQVRSLRFPTGSTPLIAPSSQSPTFDRALFRDPPSCTLAEQELKLHPLLHRSYLPDKTAAPFLLDRDSETARSAVVLPCAQEHATSPAVKDMWIKVMNGKTKVKNEAGITVAQAFEGVEQIMVAPLKVGSPEHQRWKKDPMGSEEFVFVDWLEGHTGWAGWEFAWVNAKGVARLEAGYFDS